MLGSRWSWKPNKEDFITLSGKRARTGRYVVRQVKSQAPNNGNIRNWKKEVFLTAAKPTVMILPVNKRWIHFPGLVPLFFCLTFFWCNFSCDESKGWKGEKTLMTVQFLNIFCPTCKRTAVVWDRLQVSLQPSSESSFSSPCSALPPSKRQNQWCTESCHTAQETCWRADLKPLVSEGITHFLS